MAASLLSPQGLMDFFNAYWFIIIPLIAFIFIIIYFARRGGKLKLKIYSRSEIEKVKFAERMKHNKPDNEWFFYHGKSLLGRIVAIKNITIEVKRSADVEKVETLHIVTKPTLFGWKVLFAFGKPENFILATKNIVNDGHDVILKIEVPIHNFTGINYDESIEERLMPFIKHDVIMRTEYEDFASVAYVKAMEQSTLDPEHANITHQHQLNIEQEKEKRKTAMT